MSGTKTPKTQKSQSEIVDKETNSGKKLRQARLPFKILTPSGESTVKDACKDTTDAKKRKLSYDQDDNVTEQASKRKSIKGTASGSAKKNKTTLVEEKKPDIVLLSDSSDEGNNVCIKENVNGIKSAKQKPFDIEKDKDLNSDDLELLESSEDESKTANTSNVVTKRTPMNNKKFVSKKNKVVSEKKINKSTEKGKNSGAGTPTVAKVQIKLPHSTKRSKRRKLSMQQDNKEENCDDDVLSDGVECLTPEVQPTKKQKFEDNISQKNNAVVTKYKDDSPKKHNIVEVIESDNENQEQTKKVTEIQPEKNVNSHSPIKIEDDIEKMESSKSSLHESDEELASESDFNKSKTNISCTTTDVDADGDTEATDRVDAKKREVKIISTDDTAKSSSKVTNDSTTNKLEKKILTPKQQKLHEQRLKAREEKERKIQEERLQKQREKEERELAKKRERDEKEEQKRKEREEKEDQRRKERDEKERKRLAELEAKNEEKRKKNEAKEEELRKKEEERKRKEQEKEEAEMKKKKAALAFTKFFSRPATENGSHTSEEHHNVLEDDVVLAFRPFQVRGDMKLAPIVRKKLTDVQHSSLDSILQTKTQFKKSDLYINQLKTRKIAPCKWCPPTTFDLKQPTDNAKDTDDVMIIEDDLEDAGQAIVEEHNEPIERLRVKFYKFAENRRPPYYGTWRKKSKIISARNPFAQDKQFFDYEVDSDDEWEEEEPGESLDGSDDDKEKESEDEDYEVDNEWFVPHGHLSEEEMQNEDDLGDNNDREAQKAKLQILQQEFAQEMKKKTEKIKPRLIGCIWVDENGNQPELCPKIIWNTLNTHAILCGETIIVEEPEIISEKNGELNSNGQSNEKSNFEAKLKPIALTEMMLKQLVKLVHGNTHSKNFIIREFIAYIEANEESVRNGDVRGPLKSVVREKIDEFAQWKVIERERVDQKNNNSDKKKKNKKKLCWIVTPETLKKMDMESLGLNNNWQYILSSHKGSKTIATSETEAPIITLTNGEDSNEHSEASVEQSGSPSSKIKRKSDIKKFTKVLTAEEKAKQLQKNANGEKTPTIKSSATTPSSGKSTSKTNVNTSNSTTPIVKKRVPLLMSVARGQAISTPDKNARISQFLQTINDQKAKEKRDKTNSNMEINEIVVLD